MKTLLAVSLVLLAVLVTGCNEPAAAIPTTNADAIGAQGPMGPAGPQGVKGDKGDQGDPGIAGTNGTNGINGSNGAAGTNGTNGTSGITLASRTQCRKTVDFNGYPHRFTMTKVYTSAGDLFLSCDIANYALNYHGTEIYPAAQAATASCEVVLDFDGSTGTSDMARWVFSVSNSKAVFNATSSTSNGLQVVFAPGDCQ